MASYSWSGAHVRQPTACSACLEAWSRSARRSCKPWRARCARRPDWRSNLLHSLASAKPSSAMRKTGWSGISLSCALPPSGARASRSSTRNSTRRAGSTRPSSRACRQPPASPKSWRLHSIACEATDEPRLGRREAGNSACLVSVALRRDNAAPLRWLHLGFMSAQILNSMLRRALLVAATVASITLAAAGVTARAEPGVAPFDGSLQRLAEILGALHYLRNICGANEGQKWRNEMQSLVDAEAPSG